MGRGDALNDYPPAGGRYWRTGTV